MSPVYTAAAVDFARACANRGIGIVYGGGSVGLMGVVADAALEAGGEVTGVIPRAMLEEERGHTRLTELIAVDSMHERKLRMADLADAFVALPGGIGTLEEIMEVLTWLQLGLHLKPVGLFNIRSFYDPLLGFLDRMRDEGFLTPAHRNLLAVDSDEEQLLDHLLTTRHLHIPKPINRHREE